METEIGKSASRFLAGLAVGAGLMYAFDPARGRRRRHQLRDRVAHGVHAVEARTDTAARDLGHRARGLLYDLRAVFERGQPDDDVLAERVHARLGHLIQHPRAVELEVRDGRVKVRGRVPEVDMARILGGVLAVRGVRGVDSELAPSGEAGEAAPVKRPIKWSPAARLLAALAGGASLVYAARHTR